jgi:hypothetical protein
MKDGKHIPVYQDNQERGNQEYAESAFFLRLRGELGMDNKSLMFRCDRVEG